MLTSGNGSSNGHSSPLALADEFWQIDEEAVLHAPPGFCYEIVVDTFFIASHFVVMEGNQGPIHSHSYRLQVHCKSHTLSSRDHVVVGYQTIREQIKEVVQAYNNHLLNDLPPFQRLQPTTENLAAVLFQQLQRLLEHLLVELISLTVWESPTEAVTYRRE